MRAMAGLDEFDLIIIGGGPGGIISLHYALQAGLRAIVIEQAPVVGGLWTRLPAWQDIQNRAEDWTLGDLPIVDEYQPSVAANIQAWVDRFALAPHIRVNCQVLAAAHTDAGWSVQTPNGTLRSRALISATGVHNQPLIPTVRRNDSRVLEFHSLTLRDPTILSGKTAVVVGGGASAFDLLDLCIEHNASRVVWVYRSLKWMAPTRKAKRFASNVRELAKAYFNGESVRNLSAALDMDLRSRYRKFGLEEILPLAPFDLDRDQLIPGRHRMIERFRQIERHNSQIGAIDETSVQLEDGATVHADIVLWGTGYTMNLSHLPGIGLERVKSPSDLARRCGALVVSLDAPNLYFISVGLESTSATPWHYAHLARTIVSQICGTASLGSEPVVNHLNYFGVPPFLAEFDSVNFPEHSWQGQYRSYFNDYPNELPLPIPKILT